MEGSGSARFVLRAILLHAILALCLPLGAVAASSVNSGMSAAAPSDGVVVYLQPLGDGLSAEDLDAVGQALGAELGAVVRILAPRPLPASAYYPPRGRFRAEKLLDFLEPLLPIDGDRILGVTARDISTTRGSNADWGLVGLASYTRPVGVVSKFRCLRGAAGSAGARARLSKIAVHEIGHTLGLEHCEAAGCLMQDARGRVSICEQMTSFCPRCRDRMDAVAGEDPPGLANTTGAQSPNGPMSLTDPIGPGSPLPER